MLKKSIKQLIRVDINQPLLINYSTSDKTFSKACVALSTYLR